LEINFKVWENDLLKTPAHIVKKRVQQLIKEKKDNPQGICPFMGNK
jgi:hypothetical protein